MVKGKKPAGYAPEFPIYGRERWLNAEPLTMKSLRGKIVLVDFWDYTCVNCIRTLPYVEKWAAEYAPYNVVVIGVHTPEFEFAKTRANVEHAVDDFGITYPVVLDNDYEIWRLYANSYWPRKYIVDPEGRVVYDHAGEGNYAETEKVIQNLIRAATPNVTLPPLAAAENDGAGGAVCYPRTPELYCGIDRGRYGNADLAAGEHIYKDPGKHAEPYLYLDGKWLLGDEMVASADTGSGASSAFLLFPFKGNEINGVMRSAGAAPVRVFLNKNGAPLAANEAGADVTVRDGAAYVNVKEGRMYRLYDNPSYGSGEFSLHPSGPGVSIYAFTFGSCTFK